MLHSSPVFVATHVTMGALIGQNVTSPALAFAVGAASHFILDLIPHGDSHLYHNYKQGVGKKKSLLYVSVDAAVSIGVLVYLLEVAPYASRGTMVAGVIGGIIPDMIVAIGEGIHLKILHWFQVLHIRIHDGIVSRVGNIPLRWGIVMQLAFLAAMIALVRR